MHRRWVICGAMLAVLAVVAVARKHPQVAHAASTTNNLQLYAVGPSEFGCPLGPAFTFCDQIVGAPGPSAGFQVTAVNAVTGLSVSFAPISALMANYAAGDFTIQSNTCTGNLGAGQQCVVSVQFSPTMAGLRAAALTVTDAGGDTLAINVEGTGKNLAMMPPAAPACTQGNAFTYCAQPVGAISGTETFTIFAGSGGASGINVALAATPGLSGAFSSGDFAIVANTCGALAANGSCTVGLEFTPQSAGLRAASLVATDSAGDATQIYLAGQTTTGIVFPLPLASANTSSCARVNLLGFCDIPTGGATAANAFTLFNSSGSQVTGLKIPAGSTTPNSNISPDFTVRNTTCTVILAAGASCQINVAFTPQSSGLRQGQILVTDDQGDVVGLDLAGVGDDFNLQLASSQSLEVTVAAGGTAKFSAQVAPDSVFGLNGEQVTFVCPTNLPNNTSCAITPCPAPITAGSAASFQITFVTSSATKPAPVPTGGCAGYGPNFSAASPGIPAPNSRERGGPGAAGRSPLFPDLALIALLPLLVFAFGGQKLFPAGARRRVPFVFACAGVAAMAIFAGCHHGTAVATPVTTATTTTMLVQGNALDANGNPLNAGRTVRLILNVTSP